MIALKLLPFLQLVAIFFSTPIYSQPTVYGTKRTYGRLQRSNAAQPTSWSSAPASTHLPYQQLIRTQHYPMSYNYYDMYPGYGQAYPDEYYYPREAAVTYPAYYYPPARTSKYEVYQAVLPYYYDRPLMRGRYGGGYGGGYYGYDDVDPLDVDDDLMQEAEREQREDNQPIGQEMYYENDDTQTDNLNDVNAAFLQNLIMSQMYKDSLGKSYKPDNDDDKDDDEVYGTLDTYPPLNHQDYYKEDEEVSELKQLTKNKAFQKQQHMMKTYKKPQQKNDFMHEEREPTPEERLHWFQHNAPKKERTNNFFDEEKRSGSDRKNSLPINDRKSNSKVHVTTAAPSSVATQRFARQGQKEEVMLRPATPVKHPFPSHMAVMMSKKDRERERTPSVYDTIKHMLDMEKSLEIGNEESLKPPMRKRIVLSEDSLTQQLSVLRKQ